MSDFFRETSSKSSSSLDFDFFTKPFKAFLPSDLGFLRGYTKQSSASKTKPSDRVKLLALEDERTEEKVHFNLYFDSELSFLDPKKKKNQVIRANIIDGGQDDDCLTDED